eukprot:13897479-Ditylum_brightwellii.AAC.1
MLVAGLVALEGREGTQTGETDTLKRREPSEAIQQLGLENDLLGRQRTNYQKRSIPTSMYYLD